MFNNSSKDLSLCHKCACFVCIFFSFHSLSTIAILLVKLLIKEKVTPPPRYFLLQLECDYCVGYCRVRAGILATNVSAGSRANPHTANTHASMKEPPLI